MRMSRTISSMTHLGQELQDISFLLTQGKHRCQNALNKKAALFTLRAKTMFSPKDATPQRALCSIVGGFNSFVINECPKGGLEFDDIGASFAGGGLIGQHANLQQSFDFSPKGLDKNRKVCQAQGAISNPMPMAEHEFSLLEQQLADHSGFTASFKQCLKIPFQMSPTHLASQWVKSIIGCPSIRSQDTREILSEQAFDPFCTAGGQQQKDGHQRSRSHPQPGGFTPLMPAGFIHIDTRLLAGIGFGFFHRYFQGGTDRLLLRRNAAQANLGVKANFYQLDHIPVTHSEPPTQIADHRLGPWPKAAFWHIFRPASTRLCPTHQAAQGLQLILRDDWLNLGQFTHLAASWLGIFSQQQGATLVAGVRFATHRTLNLIRWFQLASMSVMSLLPTGFLPRGFGFGPGWRLRSIRGGWF